MTSPFRAAGLSILATLLAASSAHAQLRIGGFDADRGGLGAISGDILASFRADFGPVFEPAHFVPLAALSADSLAQVDILLLSPVRGALNEQVQPLSAAEQAALAAWVSAGGRAVVYADNDLGFAPSSNSMLAPFGVAVSGTLTNGQNAAVTATPPCSPTSGWFGDVTTLPGLWVGSFTTTGDATVLARWTANNQPALLSLVSGSGKLVFAADSEVLGTPGTVTDNADSARHNTLAWFGVRPRVRTPPWGLCASNITLRLPFGPPAGATFQWRRNGVPLADGPTGTGSTITGATDANLTIQNSSAADAGHYDVVVSGSCGGTTAIRASVGQNAADVASLGGALRPDGLLTADDVVAFLQAFFSGDLLAADLARLGGELGPDNQLTADDVVKFLVQFFAVCP